MDKLEEMKDAVKRLNEASDAYYNGRGELMSDFEWDALFDRVRELEEQTGVSLPDSPVGRVSADDIDGRKEPHEFAALSLAKTKKVSEIAKWAQTRPIWLSWKLDGLTLVVTYDNGRLSKVVTRGNGHIGTNITHLAPAIAGIPAGIPVKGHLVVRGEAVISYADFREFLAESREDYANPRNLASGSLTLKDLDELRRRRLRWIAFTLVHLDGAPDSWGARMDALDAAGFATVEREMIASPSEAAIQAAIDRWTERVVSGECPYPVDGLVASYDDTAYAATGSVTGHHATRAGLAFKWQDETAETELESIEWSCAVASICPVAVFKPVELEGTTVRRASLCNVSECERLGIAGPGTKIKVIKSNKIIPKVVAVTERSGTFEIPAACPVCGAPTEVRVSPSLTRTLRCTNASCAARELRRFERFVSKDGLDVEGLAVETLARFINRGWLRTLADIFRLAEHRDEIAASDGFGAKSADNLVAALEKAKAPTAVNFLVALSIPLCGPDVAKRLLAVHPLAELVRIAREASRHANADLFAAAEGESVFAGIDGIGPGKSAAFVRWFADDANAALVEELLRIVKPVEAANSTGGSCSGLTFVITGELSLHANRDELIRRIESKGGHVAGSVSKKTSFLINNDSKSQSAKNRKASELGVPVITETEWAARFGDEA